MDKILDKLKTSVIGRTPIFGRTVVEHHLESIDPSCKFSSEAFELTSTLTFEINQIFSGRDSNQALSVCGERAKKVLAHELYGTVVEKLHRILHARWEEGSMRDDKVADLIQDLINDLTLR